MARDQPHLPDRGVRTEAADADRAPVIHVDNDADPAFEDEVHGIGRLALCGDDDILVDIEPFADRGQLIGMVGASQGATNRARSVPQLLCPYGRQ